MEHPHISGHRHADEPDKHGINDGSGKACATHSYSKVDDDGNAVKRDESLTDILVTKGVQEVNLISAIVALGEGEMEQAVAVFLVMNFSICIFFSPHVGG